MTFHCTLMMAKYMCNFKTASAGQLPALHPGRQLPAIGGLDGILFFWFALRGISILGSICGAILGRLEDSYDSKQTGRHRWENLDGSNTVQKIRTETEEPFSLFKNWLFKKTGSQNGTLVSANMDQNLRNPSCLILSHTQLSLVFNLGSDGTLQLVSALLVLGYNLTGLKMPKGLAQQCFSFAC